MTRHKIIFVFVGLLFSATCLAQGYDYLVREAERTIAAEKYQEALDLYEKAFESGEFHYNDFFNAACACAILGNPDGAFAYLDRAVEEGLIEKGWLERDEDLASLRQDERWPAVITKVEDKLAELEASFPERHDESVVLDLPDPKYDGDVSVEEALKHRRSIRAYKDAPLTLEEISQLLWAAYGITQPMENAPEFLRGGLRAAPSAGARFPLDLYVVARNVEGLNPGIYWYKSENHTLILVSSEDKWEALSEANFNQPHFRTAAAAFVYSAVFERNMAKYGQRGRERYVCMDLGHSAENVYLQAFTLKIGTCAIGAFTDVRLKQVVGMTKEEESLYVMPLGRVE